MQVLEAEQAGETRRAELISRHQAQLDDLARQIDFEHEAKRRLAEELATARQQVQAATELRHVAALAAERQTQCARAEAAARTAESERLATQRSLELQVRATDELR
jgi:hypothetical protein